MWDELGTRSRLGAGATCTRTFPFILAAAVLPVYDCAESLALCTFLATVSELMTLRLVRGVQSRARAPCWT